MHRYEDKLFLSRSLCLSHLDFATASATRHRIKLKKNARNNKTVYAKRLVFARRVRLLGGIS